jgi:lipopolysaccharide transport system ATP-binding protein
LAKGEIEYAGDSRLAVEKYLEGDRDGASTVFDVEHAPRKVSGSQAARLLKLNFDRPLPHFAPGEDFSFTATIRATGDVQRLRFSITIFTCDGYPVGSCFSQEQVFPSDCEFAATHVTLPCPRLAPGRYHCGIAIGKGDHRTGHVDYDVVLDTLPFEVVPEQGGDGTLSHWALAWGRIAFADMEIKVAQSPLIPLPI